MRFIICLLFAITAFSQSKPIELKIDTIITSNTEDNRRKFTIKYHLTNLTDKPITFVLDTATIIPIGGGSLRPKPYYKLYENKTSIDLSGIFTGEQKSRIFKSEKEYNSYRDSLTNYIKNRTPEELVQLKRANFIENIQKMRPNETKNFTAILFWNKQRYHKNDFYEHYIQENEPHFLELHINLMKEELLLNSSEDERKDILKDQNLTKGWFTSNKVPIDFNE
ncbi:hypothetical protein [Flavobacterium sp. 25HG05S-40]|uniref:hypothetical protein n=1 Tax=Flavobacterium sp. 25HG05S-40 TaxID=3458682 RepID=UPI004044E176